MTIDEWGLSICVVVLCVDLCESVVPIGGSQFTLSPCLIVPLSPCPGPQITQILAEVIWGEEVVNFHWLDFIRGS
jgi:hypothetical protein